MSKERGRFGPLVGSIDEGTSSTRFLVSKIISKKMQIITFTFVLGIRV